MSFFFNTPTTNTGLPAAAPGANVFGGFGAKTAAPPNASTLGGLAASAAPSFSFPGTVSAAPTLSFGSPATAAPTSLGLPAFGASTMPFGSTAPSAFGTTAPSAFGTTAPSAFGTTAPSAFGTTAPSAFGAAAPSAFGAAAPSAFGAPPLGTTTATVAPTFSFATPATSAPTTAPPAFGAPMTGALGGAVGTFSFAKPQPTAGASLNFKTTTTTATAQPFTSMPLGGSVFAGGTSGGVFGKPLTAGGQPAAAPPAFVGLGGIDVTAMQPKLGDNKQDGIKIKETQVPDEIVKTVDALKTYIKQQKTISSDIGRTSTSKLSNVSHEITNLRWVLQNVANSVDANHQQIKQIRSETAKAIQSLEMAQRTQDTPAALQFENNAPFQYFQCLVAKYEEDLISFRQQITLTERHMHALANPQNISPDDLKRGFRQLNESFISLAGRLHEVHQRVEEQKEHYLNLRRYRLRDATNVFAKLDSSPDQLVEPSRITSGPTPFYNISGMRALNKSYASATASSANNTTGAK
ncbi:Nup58 [Drosophila busckii]|uniref:Nup58 n=1 Tax=Drosophila busckii TaxID=30019 RepID=A0A0M4EPX6_DROBS|nr:nuclear pore complex protein Nup58 [Drosophila busckii]ALC46951.1 Nup58 [Drosophila busckii]